MNRVFQLLCIMATLRLLVAMAPHTTVQSAPWDEPFSRVLRTLTVTLQKWTNVSMTAVSVLFPIAIVVMLIWQQRHKW